MRHPKRAGASNIPIYTDQQKKIIELVKSDVESTQSERSALDKRIKARRQMYNGERNLRRYAGRANVKIPFPYTYVQNMIPRYMSYIFGGGDVVKSYPRGEMADWDKAHNTEYLINFQMIHEAEFYIKAMNFVTALSRDGVGIQKVKWNDQLQCAEIFDIQAKDFAMDKKSSQLSQYHTSWCAHLVGYTKQELIDGAMSGDYNPEAVTNILRGEPNTALADGTKVSASRGIYRFWEWWGDADIGEELDPTTGQVDPARTGVRPSVITFAPDSTDLLSAKSSRYVNPVTGKKILPFVYTTDVDDPFHYTEAKSELDSIEPLYETACDVLNQRLDNVTQSINGLFKVRKGSGIDVESLVSSPWGVITVTGKDDIERLDTPEVTQRAYQEVGALVDLMKMGTGLMDQLRGDAEAGAGTATESNNLLSNASLRPGFKQQKLAYTYVKRVAELFLALDQLFMTKDKPVAITGDQDAIRVISPADIIGEYELLPRNFSLIQNKEARLGLLQNMLNITGTRPQYAPVQVVIMKEMFGLANINVPDSLWQGIIATGQQQIEMMNYQAALQSQVGMEKGPRAMPGEKVVTGSHLTGGGPATTDTRG